jgi:cell division septum initiation protein DivIVA
MDILALVDRLEELFNNSRPIPLTHNVIVDEDKFLDIIDQMRITIPEEVKKAQKIYTEKERLLAQAQEESARITAKAREKAEQLIDENAIVQEAKHRADQIIEQARMEAEGIKADSDQYALDSLMEFELKVEQLLNQIRNGILVLENKKNPTVIEKKPQGES